MSGEAFYRQPLSTLDGCRLPGGCDDCTAYQEFDASRAPLYRVTVHHDETCPWLKAKESAS